MPVTGALEDRDPPRGCSELGADYRTRSEARVGADVSGNRVRPLTQPVQWQQDKSCSSVKLPLRKAIPEPVCLSLTDMLRHLNAAPAPERALDEPWDAPRLTPA